MNDEESEFFLGISLTIPRGAVREGVEQEVYFEVHQNTPNPTIICGPPGVQFQQPVKLILPHSTDHDAEQTSLFIDGVHYCKSRLIKDQY